MLKRFKYKIKEIPKVYIITILIFLIFILTLTYPSLARYKNRARNINTSIWNGEVATSYNSGSGSKSDPFVISTGSELAYLQSKLKETDYENTYFVLNNDIILNDGIFDYDKEIGYKYIIDNKTYYIDNITNKLYEDSNKTILAEKQINSFSSLDNFKGQIDGNSYTIFGTYISNNNALELGFFNKLEGEVKNLNFSNALIIGNEITGGLAAVSNNASIKNILFDGFVIANNKTEKINTLKIADQNESAIQETKKIINISSNFNNKGITTSTKLSGNCSSDATEKIYINKQEIECNNNNFEIVSDLSSNYLELDLKDSTYYQLTNLEYVVNYQASNASGIVAKANNTTLENVINKADIYSYGIASGLIGTSLNNNLINQSYNTGNINSHVLASGIIGIINEIEKKTSIKKSYNTGKVEAENKAGIIGIINEAIEQITIEDTFQTSSEYSINTINNANVTVTNSYQSSGTSIKKGNLDGEFIIDTTNIKNKINYENYLDNNDLELNKSHVWNLEKSILPVLFIDDILNSNISITVGNFSWNNYSTSLKNYYYKDKLNFKIENNSNLPITNEIYYYLSKEIYSKEELGNIENWVLYKDITSITEEGEYIIYIKSIDNDQNIEYINTDILILDSTAPKASINYNKEKWESFNENPKRTYINSNIYLTITAEDTLSGIKEIKYYINDKNLTIDELNNLDNSDWLNYNNSVEINTKTHLVVYVKVIDNSENIFYLNSNYLIYGGYKNINTNILDNEITEKNINITNNSTIALTYQLENDATFLKDYTRNIVVDRILPDNTKIIIKDLNTNNIFSLTSSRENVIKETCINKESIKDCYIYQFNNFNEIGTISSRYSDNLINKINDNYKIYFDFSKVDTNTNEENINIELQIRDNKNNIVFSTLEDTIKNISLLPDKSAKLNLESNFLPNIFYNSNSITEIPIKSNIYLEMKEDNIVYDTINSDKLMILAIKMVDSNNKIVPKKYLKNLEFMFASNYYSPNSDGIVRINLGNIKEINNSLKIITNEADTGLENDNYHFEIHTYLSEDGIYSDTTSNILNIPIKYKKDYENSKHNFNIEGNNRILEKNNKTNNLNFTLDIDNLYINPSLRISLYKKKIHSAYDNSYEILDLGLYTSKQLEKVSFNTYKVDINKSNFDFDILTEKLTSGGYNFLFELYEENNKVEEINYKFIIK